MPLVVLLFVAARIGGGTTAGERSHYSNLFLTVHVGFVLAAFAGFTLAAVLATLYLLEERRLQNRSPDILRHEAAVARRARAAHRPHDRDRAAAADGRARRRLRPTARGGPAVRCADGRRRRDLARLRGLRLRARVRAHGGPARDPRVRVRDRRAASCWPGATFELLARRHLASRRARSSCGNGWRCRSTAPPRSRGCSATPSASRPATAPRSTSPTTTGRARSPRSRSSPASRFARSPTGCTTTRPRCTSSASRPVSTR